MVLLRALPLLLASLALPCVARAADDATIEKAKVLFEAGIRAREAGDCTSAVRLFQESLATYRSESLGALLNIADCERMTGQTAASYLHYGEFLRGVKKRDERIPEAADAMAAMMKEGPWIRIIGREALASNASILLDGVSLGPITKNADYPAEPGDHVIVIETPQQPDRRLPFYVAKGERREVDVRLRQTSIRSDERPLRPVGFVIGGLGLASIAAGAITGVAAVGKRNELDRLCSPDPSNCTALSRDELARRKGEGIAVGNASTATFIVGGALAAVGATLILLPPSKANDIAFAPLVLPGGGGLSFAARF